MYRSTSSTVLAIDVGAMAELTCAVNPFCDLAMVELG
jgi:hypothetical protein